MKNNFVLVIPARLNSTRLPKKLLIKIQGKSIIERTYKCALKALGEKEKIIMALKRGKYTEQVSTASTYARTGNVKVIPDGSGLFTNYIWEC